MKIEQLHRLSSGDRELVAVVEPPGHAEPMGRSCFLPGPCCGTGAASAWKGFLTSVQPLRLRRLTAEAGITRAMVAAASSMRPGRLSSQ
ncbi:hypothetical protein [Nonomuraea sp. JJY05]|uniref:hypothetical protein n=1 Tax=Nonomuraea sp. JJY05 TaxID=3350255 RepID=UPI00374A6774